MSLITEEQVELQSIEWFKELGYQYKDGYEIAPEGINPERDDFRKVILEDRLRSALIKINPDIPNQTINNSIPQILNPNIPGLLNCNREMHKWITKGLKVTFMENNQEVGRQLKLIDFENIDTNDWLVVNQFEIQGDQRLRRPDVLVFINGLPLGVIELKNPADEKADIWSAYNQLQTYKENIPDLFNTPFFCLDFVKAYINYFWNSKTEIQVKWDDYTRYTPTQSNNYQRTRTKLNDPRFSHKVAGHQKFCTKGASELYTEFLKEGFEKIHNIKFS